MSDEAAVLVEPTACAVHGALSAEVGRDSVVAVVGAGTLGLADDRRARRWCGPPPRARWSSVRNTPSSAGWPRSLGADVVVEPDELAAPYGAGPARCVLGGQLTGGADTVFDCVGSAASLDAALAMVQPGGAVVLVGMPGRVSVDLTGLWHREIALVGAYAYGAE